MISSYFFNKLLTKLNRLRKKEDGILCESLNQGHTFNFNKKNNYCLFFLLEGKVGLNGTDEQRILHEKEFILLPLNNIDDFITYEKAKYTIINCDELRHPGNISYLEKLKSYVSEIRSAVYSPFPINNKLENILQNWFFYANNEFRSFPMYDAILIVLRSIYTYQEMSSLLYPVIKGKV